MKDNSVLIMASVRWYNASAHYALFLAESFKRSGMHVVVFGIPGSPFLKKAIKKGLDVIDRIDLMNPGFFKYLINLLLFRKIINLYDIDIINPHISRDHFFAFLSLIGKRKKLIRTRTDSIPPKKNIFNKIYYKISAANYIVSSKYMVPYITGMGIRENSISVIPLGINYKEFAQYGPRVNLKSVFKIPENKIIVSFIGRLDIVKGVEYFIRSFTYLKDKNKFHYIVSGEEVNLSRNDLRELAKSLDINNITFLDRADDAREILSVTDIGVIPSIGSESICRIGLEMVSFGIPVVGSAINSIPELIFRFGGIIVKPGSPEKIASAFNYLAVPANYKKIKNRIISEIAKESPDRFVLEHMEVFSKTIYKL